MRFVLFVVALCSGLLAHAENEKVYIAFGVGGAEVSNNTSAYNDINPAAGYVDSDFSSFSFDIGFYWPYKETGFIHGLSSHVDSQFENNNADAFIMNASYAYSAMYFPSGNHGHGVFVRGDTGIVRNMITYTYSNVIDEEIGVGALIGVGFGIPVSKMSRILIGLYHSTSQVRNGEFSSTSLNISGLW